jgi:hypothetical protein
MPLYEVSVVVLIVPLHVFLNHLALINSALLQKGFIVYRSCQ